MKTVMTGALALALMAGTAGAALAQEGPAGDHDRWHDAGERPRPPQRSEAPRPPPPQQPPPQHAPRADTPHPQAQAQAPAQSGPGGWQRGPDGRTWRGAPPNGSPPAGDRGQGWRQPPPQQANPPPQAAPDRRPSGERRDDGRRPPPDARWDRDQDRRGWDRGRQDWDRDHRGWDRDRPRYDPRDYPRSFRSDHRYRTCIYRPPPGFYVRSWVFGDILPRAWWTPNYRLNSWWDYGLPIPPIGYEWVRVGADALLVDMYSGRVVQVVYDVFW